VYKYRQPAYWYFTSWQDGLIKKKNRTNITSENITDAMCKRRRTDPKAHKKEFCAYHVYSLPISEEPGIDQRLDTTMRIEYFDQPALKHFLRSGEKHVTSVCQRWIVPKGDKASVIRAAWSPNVCLIERRVNHAAPLYDTRAELRARAVTFEADAHQSQSAPLTGTVLTSQVQRACNAIIDHVAEVSSMKHRISRMVAHFRVDPEGTLWFLWCSSLRLYRDPSPSLDVNAGTREAIPRAINLDPSFTLKPQNAFLGDPKKATGLPLLRSNLFACPACGVACASKLRCEVSFKTCVLRHRRKLMQEYGHGASLPARGTLAVPPVLLKADPRLSADRFDAVKTDPTFLYRTLPMCEECALDYNAVAVDDLSNELPPALMRHTSLAAGNHGFGVADAHVTMGSDSLALAAERAERLIDKVLNDRGSSLGHSAAATVTTTMARGLSGVRHTVNFSHVADSMRGPSPQQQLHHLGGFGSGGGARDGGGGGGGRDDGSGYRPFVAPAVKGMPGGGGVGFDVGGSGRGNHGSDGISGGYTLLGNLLLDSDRQHGATRPISSSGGKVVSAALRLGDESARPRTRGAEGERGAGGYIGGYTTGKQSEEGSGAARTPSGRHVSSRGGTGEGAQLDDGGGHDRRLEVNPIPLPLNSLPLTTNP
jgi:hypothetical protein